MQICRNLFYSVFRGGVNLLFDFITLQDTFVNGGAAYTLEVLNGIFESGKCPSAARVAR